MADLSKLRFNGTDYNVKDASAPLRKFTNYSKTGNLPITSDDTTQTAIGKLEKALDDKINTSAKGTASGVAELDANGKVPSSQLPSYVDDVLEYSAKSSFPATGETGKIYVDTTTNKTYRWSGSAYVEISESLALGETSSTAYRGDRGKAAYDHSQITNGNPHGTTGANTNLTGYSKGSSKDAVAATDTVNAAIAKHENRINANQTNILYGLNTGVKNICNPDTWILGYYLKPEDGSLIPYPGDNGITSDFIPVDYSSEDYYYISGLQNDGNNLYNVIHAFNASKQFLGRTDGTLDTTRNVYTSSFTGGTPVGTGDIAYIRITQYGTSGHVTNIDTSLVMVCTGHAKEQSPSYQPYALPNYDLTQLEQQDRNALVECVDNGTKNKLDFSSLEYAVGHGAPTVTKTDTTITIASGNAWARAVYSGIHLKAGTYVLSVNITSATFATGIVGTIRIVDNAWATGGVAYMEFNSIGKVSCIFTVDTEADLYFSFCPNYSGGYLSTANSFTATDVMICTEADWKVSQNYAPYALPNTDLTVLEAEDRAGLVECVDDGAKNVLNHNGASFVSNGVRITYNSDKTITFVRETASNNDTFAQIRYDSNLVSIDDYCDGNHVLSGCPAGGSSSTYLIAVKNDAQTYTADSDYGNGILLPSRDSKSGIYIQMVYRSTYSGSITFKPMICTEAAWNVSQKYVPYRPNWDLVSSVAPFYSVPINHNMIYRGNNLGATLTDAQHTALSSGNFTDLYLGDYWTKTVTIPDFYELTTAQPDDWTTNYTSYYTKSGNTYTAVTGESAPTWAADTYYQKSVPTQTVTLKAVIADFDTFYAGYASGFAAINTHHAAVIVTGFSNVVWNKTNSTAGGYVASLIHKWLVGSALPQIETWFGSAKVLSHQKLLTNAITGDAASGWAWSSQKISLLSECQLYGMKVWGGSKATNGAYEPGEAFKHLNVFNYIDANLLFGNQPIWLRDIASAVGVASLSSSGGASFSGFAPAALILLS